MTITPIIINMSRRTHSDAIISSDSNNSNIKDLTISCQEISVPPAANIFAIDITVSPVTCTGTCSANVDVTYINNGSMPGAFIPTITVDGTNIVLTFDTLDPSQTIAKTFTITNLSAGYHVICAVPIGSTSCQTINVVHPPAAMSALPEWLGIGLLFGYVIQKAKKCNIYETKEECQKNDCQWKNKRCVSFNREDQFLIDTLREKQRQLKLPPEGIPVCKDNTCTIGKWKAVYRKGKAPIITHGH